MNKRNTFFKQVDRFINEYSIGQIILAGDYNDILSKIETKKIYQSKKFDKPAVHNLKSMIKSHKLIDIWRQKKNKLKHNLPGTGKINLKQQELITFLSQQKS